VHRKKARDKLFAAEFSVKWGTLEELMQICLHPLNTVWSTKKSKRQLFQRLNQESNLKQARHPPSSLPTISNEFQPANRQQA
jgi:hypothetical protein